MERILILGLVIFSSVVGYAATPGQAQIECDYTVASNTNSSNGKDPKEVSGKMTLVQEGKTYKGSFDIDANLKVSVEATISNELNLSVKASDNRNQSVNVLASAAALFPADNSGNFAGKVFLRSAALETIAIKNEVQFEQAPLEQLPYGNNFIGTLVSCK